VNVTFSGNNYVFVTSTEHDGNLGGQAGGDVICNTAASSAHLPGHYVAWLATSSVNAASRLGGARGWMRPDGLPFADTVAGLKAGQVFYPPQITEKAQPSTSRFLITGANGDGSVVTNTNANPPEVQNCSDFTTNSSAPFIYYANGDPNGGSIGWTTNGNDVASCSFTGAVACFGTDLTNPVTVPPKTGRRAFVSKNTFVPGGGLAAADALCRSEAMNASLANAQNFQALLATGTATAASRFNLTRATWVRLDGIPVFATAAALPSNTLTAALSQYSDGTYVVDKYALAFTGAQTPSIVDPSGAAATCQDWTSASITASGWIGQPITTAGDWFGRLNETVVCQGRNDASDVHVYLYCLEN
jgi:hypothetical protein